jgi:hypothetical protein
MAGGADADRPGREQALHHQPEYLYRRRNGLVPGPYC